MAYLRDDVDAVSGASEDEPEEEPVELEQFRLANIKDRPPIFEAEALHDAYEDFAWHEPRDWIETQVISLSTHTAIEDVNNDTARELAFYNNAKQAAESAISRFEAAGVPWRRPADYYAENVKSDSHMAKVKEQLMYEQRTIEEAEQRRKNREARAFSKQVQAEKQKDRIASKKAEIASITKLRQQRAASGFAGELDFDEELNVRQHARLPVDKAGQRIKPGGAVNKKRQVKDAQFGFGGRKRLRKQNSAASSADMKGLAARPLASKGRRDGGAVSSGVKKRPGKMARQAKQRR